MLDPAEPAIARERAFAVLARTVAHADYAKATPVAAHSTGVAVAI
jgi:hypothetical protein